jgi:hypothetical protein
VDADDLAVAGQLDRPGDQGDLDGAAGPGSAGPVHDTGEGDRAVRVGDAHDRGTGAGAASAPLGDQLAFDTVLIDVGVVGAATLDVGGDQDAGMQDFHQPTGDDDFDWLAGEDSPNRVPEAGHRDGADTRCPALTGLGGDRQVGLGCAAGSHGEDLLAAGEPEPVDRRMSLSSPPLEPM